MHPASTRQEFLRLRSQGLSFARIGRQLGVSKPTLIAWSRQPQPEIHAAILEERRRAIHHLAAGVDQELTGLNRKLTALRQELFSRALRDIPTPHLETLAGQLRQRIQHLQSVTTPHPQDQVNPPTSPATHESANPSIHRPAAPEPIRT